MARDGDFLSVTVLGKLTSINSSKAVEYVPKENNLWYHCVSFGMVMGAEDSAFCHCKLLLSVDGKVEIVIGA